MRRLFAALVIALAGAAMACGGNVVVDTGSTGSGAGPATGTCTSTNCVTAGTSCIHDCDCCSGTCSNSFCAQAVCTDSGSTCTTDADCCSLVCGNGTCN